MRIEAFGVSSSFNVGTDTLRRTTARSGPSAARASRCSCSAISTTRARSTSSRTPVSSPRGRWRPLTNEGQLTIADGKTLDLKRSSVFEQSAGRTTLDGATSRLAVFDAPGVTLTGGILEGTGTVAANVTNGGEVRPGTSPGTLNVDGAYTQTPDGVLVAEVTAAGQRPARRHRRGDPRRHARDRDRGRLHADARRHRSRSSRGPRAPASSPTSTASAAARTRSSTTPPTSPCRRSTPATCPRSRSTTSPSARATPAPIDAVFRVRLSEPQSTRGHGRLPDRERHRPRARRLHLDRRERSRFPPGVVQRNARRPGGRRRRPGARRGLPGQPPQRRRRPDRRRARDRDDRERRARRRPRDARTAAATRAASRPRSTVAGFVPGATLRLERAGQPDIVATRVRVADDGRSLAGLLNLAGRPRAAWDVIVVEPAPAAASDTLAGAFTVEAVRAPSLWTRIDGGEVARPDQPYTAMLAYGNTGNVDATGVMLQLERDPELRPGRSARSRSPRPRLEEPRRRGRCAELYIPRLPPGTSYAPVQPFFEGSGTRDHAGADLRRPLRRGAGADDRPGHLGDDARRSGDRSGDGLTGDACAAPTR